MTTNNYDYDYLIIGSGFGGSVSACRLTEKGYSVAVMEMGRRWEAKDFAKNNWNTRRWIWRPGMKLFGYFNMRFFRHVTIICGNAVGGGSITYANTLLVPLNIFGMKAHGQMQRTGKMKCHSTMLKPNVCLG